VQLSGNDDIGGVVSGEICMRVRFPGGACLVEALPWRNKILLVFVYLAVTRFGAGGRPVRWCRYGSGACASDCVDRRAGVLGRLVLMGTAMLRKDAPGEAWVCDEQVW
jgi:hypothetical protein